MQMADELDVDALLEAPYVEKSKESEQNVSNAYSNPFCAYF